MKKYLFVFLVLLPSVKIGAYDFSNEGIYYNVLSSTEKTVEVTYKNNVLEGSYSGNITIPEIVNYNEDVYTVTSIGYSAFRFCSNMNIIKIPNTITQIKQYAFSHSGITSITIPSSVVSIGKSAFDACYSLNQITFDDSDKTLEFEAGDNSYYFEFENCPLKSVYLGRNIKYYSSSPFLRMSSIEKVTFGNGLTAISGRMFFGCDNIKYIKISQYVTTIGLHAFYGCKALKVVVFDDGDSPLSFSSSTSYPLFEDCAIDSVYWGRNAIGDTHYVFLRASVSIVHIGECVEEIPYSLFNGRGLERIYLSKNIQSIQGNAFAYNQIKDVYCYSTNVIPLYSDGFTNSSINTATLHVPLLAFDDYKNHSNWGSFGSIVPIVDYITGKKSDGVYWSSFYSNKYNYIVDTSTNAYSASFDDYNKMLYLTAIKDKIIKAGQGVILKSTSDNIELTWIEASPTESYYVNNILKGVDVETPTSNINGIVYVLGNGTDGVGFYKYGGDYLKPHRAFMAIDNSQFAPASLPFSTDVPTKIMGIDTDDHTRKHPNIYDCYGRFITNPTKGIYIINGKKKLIK